MCPDRIKAAAEMVFQADQKTVKRWKFHHKFLFATVVFIGAVFLWYGVWDIIQDIPIISNPYVATLIGFIILTATGMYYENTL